MKTIDLALAYGAKQWQSFPCVAREKKPLVRWAEMASFETNMLIGWWDTNPDANIGIACGARSGIVVVDIDADHNGYESLDILRRVYGDLPETPTVKTGSGGRHIYFKHPGVEIRNSAGKIGQGIDIRGDGGYVVAPPSIHPNGNVYEWIVKPSQTPLADMPAWLVGLLTKKEVAEREQPAAQQDKTYDAGEKIPDGQRHDFFVRLAGSMQRKGFSADAIYQALLIENARCVTPSTPDKIMEIAKDINTRYPPQDAFQVIKAEAKAKPIMDMFGVIDEIEADIIERQKNPKNVWGIHYAYPYLSLITGGKQKGELIILAGEPGVGKSWWAHQDALYTAIGDGQPSSPVLLWSGEMRRKQVMRRMLEMLGIPKRHMMVGNMSDDDWQTFREAKALIVNSPLYISDIPLDLCDLKPMLQREIGEHGIEQVVFDYDWLINAPGNGEIEKSQNTSREMKNLAHELNISIVMISSVNKTGMDSMNDNVIKTNVSGSGKKLHDADVIYILTKFNEKKNSDMSISPNDYEKIATLHIAKARELDFHIPGGVINYMRQTPNPRFAEMKDLKTEKLPPWIDLARRA